MLHAYLAPEGRTEELRLDLETAGARLLEQHGRLVLAADGPVYSPWAQNVWLAPEYIAFRSVSDGADKLKQRLRNWALLDTNCHRRAQLIQAALPHVSNKPLRFGDIPPKAPLGSFTLLDPNLMLASAPCSSPFPNGEWRFEEQRRGPPNRAYLKLWELFARTGVTPRPGDKCLDLGSSPGGWTYVLARLGADVVSVDKAPLDPSVEQLPNVRFVKSSAFALDPEQHRDAQWLFSDVICYPARLLQMLRRWLLVDAVDNFVCTLKFQGQTDHDVVREFAEIPGSELVHLSHNRHELTWYRLRGAR